ncbi:hypothetical protein [Bradyrhizobium sp. CCBAU 53421]|uniref:hypothetical protein n=1 Tax=Bradyrhizobium sp. CCBAU 53421 TaxID=1325120 RepID=UPI00188B447B|nr:hypothetical protein [Bradyrhizobium sp. CCBAU 53421]QOZ36062.1 hypothetical protein XH92_33875 [Bradyrhizobium sp. CCBAU 53421]
MAEDNVVYPENTRSQVDDALQGFSTDELRDLLTEIEQFLSPEAKPRRPGLRLAGGTYINESIARANTDHYLDLFRRSDVPTSTRPIPNSRSLEEEDRLVRRSEQLEFAEGKAATCRAWADRQRRLTESFAPGSVDREQAEQLLVNFEVLAQVIEGFCRRMRLRVNHRPL